MQKTGLIMKSFFTVAFAACFATFASFSPAFAEAEQKDYDSIDAAPEENELRRG